MVIVAYLPPFAASQNSARNFSESCSLQHITFQASIVHHCICIYINICGICLRLRQRHSILFYLSFAFCWQQNWPHYSISDAFLLVLRLLLLFHIHQFGCRCVFNIIIVGVVRNAGMRLYSRGAPGLNQFSYSAI